MKVSLNRGEIAASALTFHFHGGKKMDISSIIPEFKGGDFGGGSLEFLKLRPSKRLERIHYSWLSNVLNNLSGEMKSLFLASLPKETGVNTAKFFNLPAPKFLVSEPFKSKILYQSLKKWEDFNCRLPVDFLPQAELTPLLNYSKKELVDLIDYLGIFDLAEQIRNIVDQRLIKMLYGSLSPAKQEFLKVALSKKEKFQSPSLNLEMWDGSSEKLLKLLHHRGIVRLGVASCGQNQDLVWYLIHSLDSGRGEKVMRFIEQEPHRSTPQMLQEIQVIHNFLQTKKGS